MNDHNREDAPNPESAPSAPVHSRLGFSFRPGPERGSLSLGDQVLFGWLGLESLELEVPGAAPSELAHGPETFQRRRTRLEHVSLRLDPRLIERYLARSAQRLAGAGIEELAVRAGDGFLSVAGRVREGKNAADVTCRLYLLARGLGVRLLMDEPCVYGYLPAPAPLVGHRLCAALLAADPDEHRARDYEPATAGLGQFDVEPLHALLWHTMPPAGWRLPSTRQVELTTARISRSGVDIAYGPNGQVGSQAGARRPRASTQGVAGLASVESSALAAVYDQLREADDALLAGDVDSALRGYRGELAAGGPDQPAVVARVLAVSSAHPAYFAEAAEFARQILGRWPESAAAHAALANLAAAQGDARTASSHYQRLVELAGEDDHKAVAAALAGARLLRTTQPETATVFYERVLDYAPAHAEARAALVERYTAESRWHELVRLLRARIAQHGDAGQASLDHVRLAQVLAEHLDDVPAARDELERACELDPDNVKAFEALAEQHLAAGDSDSAIACLEHLAGLWADQGDVRAQVRTFVRAAGLCEELGNQQRADDLYQRALALDPADAQAVVGAATAAAERGDHARAIELWTELLAESEHPPRTAARYQLELGRSLLATGERSAAKDALEQATRQGSGDVAGEAHSLLADLRREGSDFGGAADELDAAILALTRAAEGVFAHATAEIPISGGPGPGKDDGGDAADAEYSQGKRYLGRAAQLALERAMLLGQMGRDDDSRADFKRAHTLARDADPERAREAARSLLRAEERRGDRRAQRRWLDALLATQPETEERLDLLLSRAELRARDPDDADGALRDVHSVLAEEPGDNKRAVALGLQARLLAATGDRQGQARALADRAGLILTPLERAEAEAATAEAWLDAEDSDAALDAARRAVDQIDRARARGETIAADTRAHIFSLLGDMAWRHRAWPEVARCYGELIADDPGEAGAHTMERIRYAYRLGTAQDALGDRDSAVAAFWQVLESPGAPGDVRTTTWRALARLHERAGALLEAARCYESMAADHEALVDMRARADAWYSAGALYRRAGEGGATDGAEDAAKDAERCLETALDLVDDHLPALDALEHLAHAQGDHERMASILSRKIAVAANPGRQKALLARLAELQYQHLGRTDVARETYLRALDIDPELRPALRFIAADALGAGDLETAADAYARLARELSGDDELEDSREVLLEERVAAAELLADIVKRMPARSERGQALRDRARGVLAALIDAVPDHPTLTACLDELGADDSDSEPEDQEAELEDPAVLRERADQAADAGDHQEYARCLDLLIRATAGQSKRQRTRRAELYLELADLYYDHLGDAAWARTAMFEAAEAFGAGSRRDATLRMLAAEAEADGADAEAAEAYERIDPTRRSAADRYNLAVCYQRLSRDRQALVVLEEAKRDGLMTDQGVRMLFALRQEVASLAERAASLEARAESMADTAPERARECYEEALQIYAQSLDDQEGAERVWALLHAPAAEADEAAAPAEADEAAGADDSAGRPRGKRGGLAVEQPSAEARQAATRTAPGLGMLGASTQGARAAAREALADPTAFHAALEDADPEALEQLANAAMISGDADRAAELLARAVELLVQRSDAAELDADTRRCLERLRQAAEAGSAWEPLVRGLTTAAPVAGNAELASALWAEAARVVREGLADAERSAELLQSAVAANPGDADLVVEADALMRDIAMYEELVEVYELHLQTLTGHKRARLLFELGRMHRDVLGSFESAARCYHEAYEADPDLAEVWLPLADVRVVEDDVAGALELYERALEHGDHDDDTRAFLQNRIAALSADPDVRSGQLEAEAPAATPVAGPGAGSDLAGPDLDDLMREARDLEAHAQWDAAIGIYERAARLSSDPRPLEALASLHHDLGHGEALCEVLDRLFAAISDRRRRAQLRVRQAHIYRDLLHREEDAYRSLTEAHENDPRNPDILYELRGMLMARGEWDQAADMLQREIEVAADARDAAALYLELALIFDEKLRDAAQALRSYERALELDPDIPAAPRPLARLYEDEGRFAEAARMHERAARAMRDDSQRSHILQRAARCAEQAGDLAHARRLYQLAVVAAVNDEDERTAAKTALARLDQPAEAVPEALADTRESQRIAVLRQEIQRAIGADEREAALAHARALLALDPASASAYAVLKAQAEAAGDWLTLASLLESRAEALSDPGDKAAAYHELGRVAETRLDDAGAAVAAYERALAAAPEHPAALERLADIAFERRDWPRAWELYGRVEPGALSADVIAYRRGVAAEGMGRERDALQAFSRAVERAPGNRDALAAMSRVALRVGDLRAAVAASEAQLALVPADDVQAISAARLKLAELCQRAGEVAAAIHYNELVLAEDPRSQPALRALHRLYLDQGQDRDAARALRSLISVTTSLPKRAELLYRLGELYRVRIGDLDEAADAYLKGIDLDPAHVPTLRRLIDYYWREDDMDELLDIADSLVEQSALMNVETDDDTAARVLLAAVMRERSELAEQLAGWLSDRLADALLAVLLTFTPGDGDTTAQVLAEAVLAVNERVPSLSVTAVAEKLTARSQADAPRRLAAALRTTHSLRQRSR